MNQKCPKSQNNVSEHKNTAGTSCTPLRMIKYHGVTYSRRWATEKSFKKMELMYFEKEEENNAPIDIDDDDIYDNTDLFYEEDDEED